MKDIFVYLQLSRNIFKELGILVPGVDGFRYCLGLTSPGQRTTDVSMHITEWEGKDGFG